MRVSVAALLTVMVLGVFGCQGRYSDVAQGPGEQWIIRSVDAMGGHEAWSKVRTIQATAVVSRYIDDGYAQVTEEQHVIDIVSEQIDANAVLASPSWQATVKINGAGKLLSDSPMSAAEVQAIQRSLRMTIQRVQGALNVCRGNAQTGKPIEANVNGCNAIRVDVKGKTRGDLAYFLDPETGALLYVISGENAYQPNGTKTVTRYEWQEISPGFFFPTQIDVRQHGQHTVLGSKKLFTVIYKNVQVQ